LTLGQIALSFYAEFEMPADGAEVGLHKRISQR
jgi:hypothetical protein